MSDFNHATTDNASTDDAAIRYLDRWIDTIRAEERARELERETAAEQRRDANRRLRARLAETLEAEMARRLDAPLLDALRGMGLRFGVWPDEGVSGNGYEPRPTAEFAQTSPGGRYRDEYRFIVSGGYSTDVKTLDAYGAPYDERGYYGHMQLRMVNVESGEEEYSGALAGVDGGYLEALNQQAPRALARRRLLLAQLESGASAQEAVESAQDKRHRLRHEAKQVHAVIDQLVSFGGAVSWRTLQQDLARSKGEQEPREIAVKRDQYGVTESLTASLHEHARDDLSYYAATVARLHGTTGSVTILQTRAKGKPRSFTLTAYEMERLLAAYLRLPETRLREIQEALEAKLDRLDAIEQELDPESRWQDRAARGFAPQTAERLILDRRAELMEQANRAAKERAAQEQEQRRRAGEEEYVPF